MGWTVVMFIQEESVEVVPTSWICRNKISCYWPNTGKISQLIKNQESPKSDEWHIYKIKLLTDKEYNSFENANRKAFKARYVSDLSSAEENVTNVGKRIRKPPRKYSTSDSEHEDEVLNDDYPTPPHGLSEKNMSEGLRQEDDAVTPIPVDIEHTPILISESTKVNSCLNNNVEIIGQEILTNNFQTHILKQLNLLNLKMNNISETLDTLVRTVGTTDHISKCVEKDNKEKQIIKHLPMANIDDIQTFEEVLVDGELYESLVRYLVRSGGKDVRELVRRIMPKLMTDELATKYSWKGAREKLKFCNLIKINALLLDVVKYNFSTKDVTNKETEAGITYWLVKAPERQKKKVQPTRE